MGAIMLISDGERVLDRMINKVVNILDAEARTSSRNPGVTACILRRLLNRSLHVLHPVAQVGPLVTIVLNLLRRSRVQCSDERHRETQVIHLVKQRASEELGSNVGEPSFKFGQAMFEAKIARPVGPANRVHVLLEKIFFGGFRRDCVPSLVNCQT